MRKVLSIALLMSAITTGYAHAESTSTAKYLGQGTQELNVQGLVDFDAEDKYAIDLNAKYGYFVKDSWEVGTNIMTDLSSNYKAGGIGLFTEYNFVNSTNFVPYVGIGTELVRANYSDKRDEDKFQSNSFNATAMNFKSSLGLKYFISKNVALTSEVNYNVATDHLKVYGGDARRTFTKFLIGTSFYF
jgi:outer membrane protein W